MARQKKPDKLAQDASAALKAGMSYGKWKALQGYTPIQPKEHKKSEWDKVCAFCGEDFEANRTNQLYCSKACEKKSCYQRRKERLKKLEVALDG